MDVAGGGVDVGMAEQGLHHRKIDTGLGQRGAERVPQRVRMPADDPGQVTVVAEDRAQPGRRQRLTPVRSLGHQEQPTTGRFGSLGQQIHLDDRRDVGIERDAAFPLPLAEHAEPAATDVDIGRRRGSAPQPSGDRSTASARRSRGPARCGSWPAARQPPAVTARSVAVAARAAAARNGSSAGGPCAPASRCARPRCASGPRDPSAPGSSTTGPASRRR